MQGKGEEEVPKALPSPYAVCQRGCLALFCVCAFYNGFSEHAFLKSFFLFIRQWNREKWIKHRCSFQSTISVHRRIQGSSKASQSLQILVLYYNISWTAVAGCFGWLRSQELATGGKSQSDQRLIVFKHEFKSTSMCLARIFFFGWKIKQIYI